MDGPLLNARLVVFVYKISSVKFTMVCVCSAGVQSSTVWQTFSERDRISRWRRRSHWPDVVRCSGRPPQNDEEVESFW